MRKIFTQIRNFLLFASFALVFGLSIHAQSNDLTWQELKLVQQNERERKAMASEHASERRAFKTQIHNRTAIP